MTGTRKQLVFMVSLLTGLFLVLGIHGLTSAEQCGPPVFRIFVG